MKGNLVILLFRKLKDTHTPNNLLMTIGHEKRPNYP
jgi:hypothetical protein